MRHCFSVAWQRPAPTDTMSEPAPARFGLAETQSRAPDSSNPIGTDRYFTKQPAREKRISCFETTTTIETSEPIPLQASFRGVCQHGAWFASRRTVKSAGRIDAIL